jgi:Flp pilus assembly protein TadG
MRRNLLQEERGQAMTEMALVLPILMMFLLAIFEFGIVLNHHVTLTDAVRAGARKAAVARFTGDSGASVAPAVRAAASNLDQSKLSVTVTSDPGWTVAGSEVTVTGSYKYNVTVLGVPIASGTLQSTTKERLE